MTDRYVMVRYSNDGGHNWSSWRTLSLGALGQYAKRVRTSQLGRFVNRIWQIRVASPVKRDLLGAVAYMEPTDE